MYHFGCTSHYPQYSIVYIALAFGKTPVYRYRAGHIRIVIGIFGAKVKQALHRHPYKPGYYQYNAAHWHLVPKL